MSPPLPPIINSNYLKPLADIIFTSISLFFLFFSSSSSSHKPNHHFTSLKLKNPSFSLPHHLNLKQIFVKHPIMHQTKPDPNPFSTPQSLHEWLEPRLPPHSLASWGVTPGTKNIHNLWLELSQGETSLSDSTPPIRAVQVLSIRITHNTHQQHKLLIESHQLLSDGSIRHRSRPLSEKLKPNESIENGVVRAIKEELGDSLNVRIVPNSYSKKVEERVSLSYPGLPASYVIHSVDAWVDGLPDEEEFCTEEDEYPDTSNSSSDNAVKVKKHFWKWVESNYSSV